MAQRIGPNGKKSKCEITSYTNNGSSTQKSLVFRITYGQGNGPALLRRTLLEAGMSEYNPEWHKESQWDLWWKGFRFKDGELAFLTASQRVNHHPVPVGRQTDITKKDGLLRAVRHMCVTYPKCSSLLLFPTTFNLPREEARFVSVFCQRARSARNKLSIPNRCDKNEEEYSNGLVEFSTDLSNQTATEVPSFQNLWILKPTDLSRGRGVYVFNQLEDLAYVTKSVVQKYISDVLLIEGHKFDLRLYAVVPSYSPFIVYIYSEGLVRFATAPYNLSDLKNVYSHLTNSSINVGGPGYLVDKAGIGVGCKWTIRRFRQWMAEKNINDRFLWIRIQALIILTLLSQASDTPKVPNAYELYGFDILVDSRLRPWLLEVNANPSLADECKVDEVVKKPLLNSVLKMLRLDQHSDDDSERNPNSCSPSTHTSLSKNTHRENSTESYMIGRRKTASNTYPGSATMCSMLTDTSNHYRCRTCQATTELPLYGPGSECLLPQLTALARRFLYLLEMNAQLENFTRLPKLSPSSLSNKSSLTKPRKLQYPYNCHLYAETALNQEQCNSGRKIIPHIFGQLKLAFPFNLVTRIACASERGGYPDPKLIVHQVCRLVQYFAQLTKGTTKAMDYNVIDVPEIWADRIETK